MKTTSYTTEKEIRIGILLFVFTIATFTAFKVKELQLTESTTAVENRSNQILINTTSAPSTLIFDAKLIEETIPEVESLKTNSKYDAAEYVNAETAVETEKFFNNDFETNNEAVEAELALEVETWMTNTKYDAAEFVEAERALAAERFLNSDIETNNGAVEAVLALEVETWMTNTKYDAAEFVNAETAVETEKFFNSEAKTNYEAVEAELALEVETWMTITEYKAAKYVETEMALEIQNWMNNESFWADYPMPNVETQTARSDSPLAIE